MKMCSMTRRTVLNAGMSALLGTVAASYAERARGGTAHLPATETLVRRWYKAWEQKDWAPLDRLLADDFTFTSANDDDHISKTAFKANCWETQKDFIGGFEIEQLVARGDSAFVKYLCRTANGRSFRNVEFIQVRGDKLRSIECYFGGRSTFPSAVSTKEGLA